MKKETSKSEDQVSHAYAAMIGLAIAGTVFVLTWPYSLGAAVIAAGILAGPVMINIERQGKNNILNQAGRDLRDASRTVKSDVVGTFKKGRGAGQSAAPATVEEAPAAMPTGLKKAYEASAPAQSAAALEKPVAPTAGVPQP